MAIAYKSGAKALTTSSQTVYTCPSSTSAIVTLLQAANVDGSNSVDISCNWEDSSDSSTDYVIVKTLPLAAKTAVSLLGGTGKLILNAGDKIEALASANGDAELTYSLIEIS